MKYSIKLNVLVNIFNTYIYDNFDSLSNEQRMKLNAILDMMKQLARELEDV